MLEGRFQSVVGGLGVALRNLRFIRLDMTPPVAARVLWSVLSCVLWIRPCWHVVFARQDRLLVLLFCAFRSHNNSTSTIIIIVDNHDGL